MDVISQLTLSDDYVKAILTHTHHTWMKNEWSSMIMLIMMKYYFKGHSQLYSNEWMWIWDGCSSQLRWGI